MFGYVNVPSYLAVFGEGLAPAHQVPFAQGLMAGLPEFASHGSSLIEELGANTRSSWMSRALNLN